MPWPWPRHDSKAKKRPLQAEEVASYSSERRQALKTTGPSVARKLPGVDPEELLKEALKGSPRGAPARHSDDLGWDLLAVILHITDFMALFHGMCAQSDALFPGFTSHLWPYKAWEIHGDSKIPPQQSKLGVSGRSLAQDVALRMTGQ